MKATIMACIAIGLLCSFVYGWETSFEQAQLKATRDHKYILLNFSGSDWCGPCIRLKETIFESPVFVQYADSNLVLLNADFPRQKKNQLPPAQQKHNEQLADKYNAAGNFPYTVLLDATGKPIREWIGLPKENAAAFIGEINSAIHGK